MNGPQEPLEPEEIAETDDEGASSDDGLVFNTAKKQKTVPKAGTGKTKVPKEEKDKDKEKAEKKTPASSAPLTAGKLEKTMSKGSACMGSLSAITPLSIWQGSIKIKDCEARTRKALQVAESLEKDSSAEAKQMAENLKTFVETIEDFMEILCIDMVEGMADAIQKYTPGFLDRFCKLPADCISAVLNDVGRKIIEDSVRETLTFWVGYTIEL